MPIYFISDLHLQDAAFDNAKLFEKFLANYAPQAQAIYILGDFFHVWIGDDYNSPFVQTVKQALVELQQRQVPVFFMPGNRDFLIGQQFFNETKCIKLCDPTVIELQQQRVLLMHGDLLTTNDKSYQRFRRLVSSKIIKFMFSHLPINWRLKIANWIRANSGRHYQQQLQRDPMVFTIAENTVIKFAEQYKATTIIHGHIHQAGQQQFSANGKIGQRFVLGDWHNNATIVVYQNNEFALLSI